MSAHRFEARPLPNVPNDGAIRDRYEVVRICADGHEQRNSTWRSKAGADDQAAQLASFEKHFGPGTLTRCPRC